MQSRVSAAVASTLTKNFLESLRTKLPNSQQSKAKRALQEIWTAETKKDALTAFDAFVKTWAVKYDKAVECLTKDRDALLVFYDFPAEHWKHLRTTNVIESSFATVRHRTVRSKGCLSNKTALVMIFKLGEAAERSWRRLNGHSQLPKIILGVKFADGIEVVRSQAQPAAASPLPSPRFSDSSARCGIVLMRVAAMPSGPGEGTASRRTGVGQSHIADRYC
jgi:transposase-like protein